MSTSTGTQAVPQARPLPRLPRPPRYRQLWQVPTFFAGLLALSVVAAHSLWRSPLRNPAQRELAAARQALAEGRLRPERLVSLAEKALAFAGDCPADQAEAHLFLGLALSRLAETGPAEQRRTHWQEALEHLQQAEHLGVSEADQPRLYYALGRLYWLLHQDAVRTVTYLSRGLPQGTEQPAEGYGWLAEAYLHLSPPQVEAALEANQRQLEQARDEKLLAQAHLVRGKILFHLELYDKASAVLERIGPEAAPPVRQQARRLLLEAYEKTGQWAKAGPLLQEFLQKQDEVPGGRAHALYLLGRCRLQASPPDVDGARQAWLQASQEKDAAGQAAAWQLAELAVASSPPDVNTAALALRRALAGIEQPGDFHNPYLSLEKARTIGEQVVQTILQQHQYSLAAELAALYRHLAAPGVAEVLAARAAEGLARQGAREAAQAPAERARVLQQQARQHWQRAAHQNEQAAAALAPQARDLLWQAAQDYRLADDPAHAADLFQRLVTLGLPPERQAEAWFYLGEAQRALGQLEKAQKSYLECANFTASPFSCKARYQLAQQAIAQGQFAHAEELLVQNLNIINTQGDTAAYRESLRALADLLFRERKYEEACVRLEQVVKEYPDDPQVLAYRDRLAQCYRQLARQAWKQYSDLTTPGSPHPGPGNRAYYETKRQEWLGRAVGIYQKLLDDLRQRAAVHPLTPAEMELRRKTELALADLEYERNNCLEALRLYLQLAKSYPYQSEALFACHGLMRCINVLRLSATEELRLRLPDIQKVLHEVREHLPRIPDSELARIALDDQGGAAPTRAELEERLNQLIHYVDHDLPQYLHGPSE
jgi:tetratricopeptide (TPR) repeat protein